MYHSTKSWQNQYTQDVYSDFLVVGRLLHRVESQIQTNRQDGAGVNTTILQEAGMATIRFEGDDAEVEDGSSVGDACEELGMVFGCHDGECGTCRSSVLEGMENLEPRNKAELEKDLDDDERLACQCKIISGLVEFEQ